LRLSLRPPSQHLSLSFFRKTDNFASCLVVPGAVCGAGGGAAGIGLFVCVSPNRKWTSEEEDYALRLAHHFSQVDHLGSVGEPRGRASVAREGRCGNGTWCFGTRADAHDTTRRCDGGRRCDVARRVLRVAWS
jgi:hypothetical protein